MPNLDVGIIVTFVNNAQAGLKNLAGGVKQVGENAQVAHNRLKAIQVVIAGILLTKSIELGKSFLTMASEVQNLDIRLAKFAGGVPKATALMHRLNEEFGATGFSVEALGKDWIKLQSVMSNADKVTTTLEAIANSVAAMGGNDGDIESVTTAFQRMMGKGAPALKEVASLSTQTGIKIEDLARASGKSFTQFDQELRGGLIKSSDFIDYFIKASQDKFGNYALGLKFTIGGAMNSITNSIKSAISEIGGKTDLFARITLVFNNIDKAFKNWAATITQGDIDKFFTLLASWEGPIRSIAGLIYNVGSALITLSTITGKLLDGLPPEVIEFGIIGYMFGGKKLALLFSMLAYIGDNTGKAIANLIILLGKAKEVKGFMDGVGGAFSGPGKNLGAGIFAGDTAKIKADLDALAKKTGVGVPGGDDEGAKALSDANKRINYMNDLARAVDTVNGDLAIMNDEMGGNKLGRSLDEADKKTGAWRKTLQNLLDKNKDLPIKYQLTNTELLTTQATLDQIELITEKWKEHLTEINRLTQENAKLDQGLLQGEINRNILDLERASSKSASFNMLAGTSGGQEAIDVVRQKYELNRSIFEISKKINSIQLEINANAADPELVGMLTGTKDAYIELQRVSGEALKGLSASGEAGKKVWQEWGAAIETGVGDALVGIIDHTKTLGQVVTSMYAQITKAAANYIVKLGEIALMGDQASGGGGSGGGFANFIGSLFGGKGGGAGGVSYADALASASSAFAKGGAFHGSIKPFAKGDILTGPTLFGLGGEAGDEAIMPLKRGAGGKLGVASSGGGAIHIHINALDTQNAVEFIEKNAFHIGRTLNHRQLLNRGGR